MTSGDEALGAARPATVDDLKLLLRSLDAHGVEYFLIGGYALHALGYQRGTIDIDIVVRPTIAQGERVRRALLALPHGVAEELDPAWFGTSSIGSSSNVRSPRRNPDLRLTFA